MCEMKDRIISKATEMFLSLGFKSVTMDDIAGEMGISKKTIYKYFSNKETLIEEGTNVIKKKINDLMNNIVSNNHNAIKENFEMRKMFKEMFQTVDHSPAFQLKKHYPEIYNKMMETEIKECQTIFSQNVIKGIKEGLYRKNLDVESVVQFYYTILFSINENTAFEKEASALELKALEYHTRAIATEKGVQELEKNLNFINQ
jgi:AcrR family transcriptional regulator